jgi:TRAP-type C4-dicarboxylate transport system substrate-binding protein
MLRKFVTMFAAIGLVTGFAGAADATTTFKIGTLAPPESPWGKEFKRWTADVLKDTNGELQLDFQWNGQAGDDVVMIRKIRSGQLDGAAAAVVGLAETGVTDALIFGVPGMFSNWAKLDSVRNALTPELNKQFEAKGFTVLGWGDVGASKMMSVGFEVHKPTDLQGKGCIFIAGDPVQSKFYAAIGGITPKQLSVSEILPALTNGSVNVLPAPPLVAEQFQWASRVTHMSTQTASFIIGALIVSSQRLQGLPPNLRDAMLKHYGEMNERLTKSVRNNDAQAFARMKTTKVVYDPTDADRQAWTDIFVKLASQLRGTVFSPAFFDKVVKLADPPMKIPGVN